MRVLCPQCGREFNVPDSEVHRLLRCMCKNLFKASEAQLAPDKKMEKKEIQLEARAGFGLNDTDEETIDSDVSKLSSDELDSYLSNLKKNREAISADEHISQPPIRNISKSFGEEIELAESRAEKKAPKESAPPDAAFMETSSVPDSPSFSSQPSISQSRPRTSAPRQKAPQPESIWEKFQGLSLVAQLGILAGIATPLAAALIFLSTPEPVKEEMDPRVTRLLTPQRIEKKTLPEPAAPPVQKVSEEIPSPVVEAHTKTAPAAEPKDDAEAPRESSIRLVKMKQQTFEGDFENVVRLAAPALKDLQSEEKALYFEALLARSGRNLERIRELRSEIESSAPRGDFPSVLRRAHAVSLLRDSESPGNLKRALDTFQSLSLTRASDPLVYAYWGMALEKAERMELAHQIWDQALTIKPQIVWLLERRAQVYRAEKKWKGATAMATQLSKISEHEFDGHRLLAEISMEQNDSVSAEKHYRAALRAQENVEIRILLATSFSASAKEAVAELEQALKSVKDSKSKALILSKLGSNRCAMGETETGLKLLKTAIKERPNSSEIYFDQGLCQRRAGLEKKAAESFEAALKYDQKDDRLWYHYGVSLKAEGQMRAASAAFNRSLQLKPTDMAHFQMAQILMQQQKAGEAIVHVRKALKLNPQNQKARGLLAQLEK